MEINTIGHGKRRHPPKKLGRTSRPPTVSKLRTVATRLRENGAVEAAQLLEWAADTIDAQAAQLEREARELETERLRLAGCGVAAGQNTAGSVAQRIPRKNPYWSASYDEVCRAVDREMDLRAALESRRKFWRCYP